MLYRNNKLNNISMALKQFTKCFLGIVLFDLPAASWGGFFYSLSVTKEVIESQTD